MISSIRRALWIKAASVLTAAAGWCCGANAATASNGFEAVSADPPGPTMTTPAGARCVVVGEVVLKGELAEQFAFALRELHEDALPRCLDELGINALLQRTQTAIVSAGYATTRVLAAPQDLADGRLELSVIAGRIGEIRIEGAEPDRANTWNALPMREGDLLNLRDIEQALENFKRVPTVETDIRIVPSSGAGEPGRSDLLIAWKQSFPWRLGVALDDAGARATGKLQGSVTFSYDHWWLLNDLFYASLSHQLEGVGSSGFDSGPKANQGHVLHYSLPFGHWLLAATASRNNYRQRVAGASQTYVYSGDSGNTELRLTRLLHRDAASKTHVWVKGWSRASRNYIDDTEVEVQRRKVGGWEVGVEHQQHVGEARVDVRIATRRGTGAFDSTPAPEQAFGEGTSRLALSTAEVQLELPFEVDGQRLRYVGMARAQRNHTPLVPQDRLAIGNRFTVRGFDGEATLMAERGWLWRNEIGWRLGDSGAEAYVGLDAGQVSGPSAATLLGRRLAGAVIGLRGGWRGLSCDVFIGKPLHRPDGFPTASTTVGFNAVWSY